MMRDDEWSAFFVGAGAAAFLLAGLLYLLGGWGFWIIVPVLVGVGGWGLVRDPDE